jgi:phosphatidylglycerol:prolipoprotein diacylglycerol transferase
MLLLAFLLATGIAAAELRRRGLDHAPWAALAVAGMLGGVLGARAFWAVEHWGNGGRDLAAAVAGNGGMSYYGALLGAALALAGICRLHRIPLGQAANCYAVALPPAYIIARFGCFLAGDDYGTVTTVPWGMSFPLGTPPALDPVHPTQLYEIGLMIPVALLLWSRRTRESGRWTLMFWFGVLAGAERFLIEFWRVNPALAFGLTTAQWISMGLILAGAAGLIAPRLPIHRTGPIPATLTPRRL